MRIIGSAYQKVHLDVTDWICFIEYLVAIGNGMDRYMLHGVVDFLGISVYGLFFNVADIGICVGVA